MHLTTDVLLYGPSQGRQRLEFFWVLDRKPALSPNHSHIAHITVSGLGEKLAGYTHGVVDFDIHSINSPIFVISVKALRRYRHYWIRHVIGHIIMDGIIKDIINKDLFAQKTNLDELLLVRFQKNPVSGVTVISLNAVARIELKKALHHF